MSEGMPKSVPVAMPWPRHWRTPKFIYSSFSIAESICESSLIRLGLAPGLCFSWCFYFAFVALLFAVSYVNCSFLFAG